MQPTDSSNDLDSRIAAAVDRAVQGVRDELLTRVQAAEDRIRELDQRTPAEPAVAPAAPPPTGVGELLQTIVALDRARSQPEVLAALLEGAGRFGGRSALFLTRPEGVQGWGSYGFEEITEGLQDLGLPYGEEGPWARLAEGRGCVTLDEADCEGVCRSLGAQPAAEGLLLPFVLRDRVAAALYVDRSAQDPPLEVDSLQLLTHMAAHSVEGLAVRQRSETPTLYMAAEAAGRPGLAVWEPEPAAAELPVVEEAPPEEAAAPAFVEEEIPELEAVEEEAPALEEPAVIEEEAPVAVAPEIEEPAPVEEEAAAPEPEIPEPEIPVAEIPVAEMPAPEFKAPAFPDETAAEPPPPMELETIPEEAPPLEPPPPEPPVEIPAAEESLAETLGPSIEPTPSLEPGPPLDVAPAEPTLEEIEGPAPELPTIPDVAPPAPPLEEPPAPEIVTEAEPTRPLEHLVQPPAEPPAPPALADEAATAPLEPAPPPVTPPPPGPPPSDIDRGTTEVRPPTDIEGPGWAFTATRTAAEAGDEAQHEEARRLARLLVTEIKLYNEEQVEEGRRSNDIYARLKEDIDRSRQIFDERVDEGIREETDYFHEEMVRILGGGKPEALGL